MLLDCTFRDGGYYTNWEFDDQLVQKYLRSVEQSGVDVVEIGYRALRNKAWSGYLFYTPDEYLTRVAVNSTVELAVMIDSADILSEGMDKALSFFPDNHEKISVVRVAAHKHEVVDSIPFLFELKKRGYKTCLNLMGFQQYTESDLEEKTKTPLFEQSVDVLYFADSFGSMSIKDVRNAVQLLKKHWKSLIGFHAHNNQGAALSNALVAIEEGVEWIDSTVTGMGRGAGNLATEEILIQLSRENDKYDPVPMMGIIHDYFEPLKRKEGWGASVAYGIAALNGMHPTYIQKLYKKDYSSKQMIDCLRYLESKGASKFSSELFKDAQNQIVLSSMCGSKRFAFNDKKKVLLVGASAYKEAYKSEFKKLVESKDYFVISLNDQGIDEQYIDLYVTINSRRFRESKSLYSRNQDKVLLTPQANEDGDEGYFIEPMSYGVGLFSYKNEFVIPDNDVFWFGLAVALKMNPEQIVTFGIEKPYKDESFDDLLFKALDGVDCMALGKTSFGIKSVSIVGLLQGVN
jgi:4-hydroxy 2-oxovalerate aldolase